MKSAFKKTGQTLPPEGGSSHSFQPVNAKDAIVHPFREPTSNGIRRVTRASVKTESRKDGRRSTRSQQQSSSYEGVSNSSDEGDDHMEEQEGSSLASYKKKKLVFLSWRVYDKAKEHKVTNGTNIAREILEESRKLRMNFDFKNVQRRVYDALNVLTALDMIKKDRNKIEFIKDIHEVFGEAAKPEKFKNDDIKEERDAEKSNKIRLLNERKAQMLKNLNKKRQYFEEITIQVALLKKLVRRNLNEKETSYNSPPSKNQSDTMSIDKFTHTEKIHLPMLVWEFKKNAEYELLMNEDHNQLIIVSDQNCKLYNDNHVLLNNGLFEESDKDISNLYETEVKSWMQSQPNKNSEDPEGKENPADMDNKGSNTNPSLIAGSNNIINISSPFKENIYKDGIYGNAFYEGFLSPFCYKESPLLKNEMTPSYNPNGYGDVSRTPVSNFAMQDQGIENANQFASPGTLFRNKLEFETP